MSDGDSGRKRILDSAAFILRTKGFGAARLSEIAQGAGMLAQVGAHIERVSG